MNGVVSGRSRALGVSGITERLAWAYSCLLIAVVLTLGFSLPAFGDQMGSIQIIETSQFNQTRS
jgi:hypothetical protein